MNKSKSIQILILTLLLFFPAISYGVAFTEPINGDYSCNPVFVTTAVEPNILIILDNSTSMLQRAYSGAYDPNTEYYGLFSPTGVYYYSNPGGGVFKRDSNGLVDDPEEWNGNFLNWATMRKIDVVRKVLMGGKTTGNLQLSGENDSNGLTYTLPFYNDTTGVESPYTGYKYITLGNGEFTHKRPAGRGFVIDGTYNVTVEKDASYADEADDFVGTDIAGVLQKVGDDARWGNLWFRDGTGTNQSGGEIHFTVKKGAGATFNNYVNDFAITAPDNDWTPLGEAYYVAVKYYMQEDPETGYDYFSNAVANQNNLDDPYYYDGEFLSCADSFVILLTDGSSTKDANVPDSIKDFADSFDTFVGADDGIDCDEDTGTGCEYPNGGTDYLKDVALYARTTDLRSSTLGKSSLSGVLSGDQNVYLYTIYAFGTDTDAKNLLKEAAKNGGYEEKDTTVGPNLTSEWDEDGDGDPDTYYEATDGAALENQLLAAINDILERTSSGTAVSVLATSAEGEGTLVQAFFRASVTEGYDDVEWLGYLQSLWVDNLGNLREDSDHNRKLEEDTDKVVTYSFDANAGETRIYRFNVSSGAEYPDTSGTPDDILELDDVEAVWQAGQQLAERSAASRKIFTYIDIDDDDVVDDALVGTYTADSFDNNGEVLLFETANAAAIKPYLGVSDDTTWEYLQADSAGNTHDFRVSNLISYIRGNDLTNLRSRSIDYDNDLTSETWKLGDIINSTPVTVTTPPDNFHRIYQDETYQDFYNAFKDREAVVYVGANDGMLHAFTAWKYNSTAKEFEDPYPSDVSGNVTWIDNESIGDEIWAFIPQGLLPHLKWLPSTSYQHVFYVDMKPKIFDAKIIDDDTYITDGDSNDDWGTILLVGFNLGGGHIQAKEDFGSGVVTRDFYPSYVALDVTKPREPKVLWERSYEDLQASSSFPAVIKVKDKWFAVFGSGPASCSVDSTEYGKVFVVDLKTGAPYQNTSGGTYDWLFKTAEDNAFMNSPVSLDSELNYNVDAVYFGETYKSGGDWLGKVYKVTIPRADNSGNYSATYVSDTNNTYSENPLDATNPWKFNELFDVTRPLTASLALSTDSLDNVWIYGGTGRFLSVTEDRDNTDTQYFFGIKDPFFNQGLYEASTPVYYHSYINTLTLAHSDLLEDAQDYSITTEGKVYDVNNTYYGTFNELLTLARSKNGWIRELETSGERILTKPTLLGGIVFSPSFTPNTDECGYGGDSSLYGVYFETGTAYYKAVFNGDATDTVSLDGENKEVVVDKISLGKGKSSSLGVHIGSEEGARGFIQQSTGDIKIEDLSPALNVKSALRSWMEE